MYATLLPAAAPWSLDVLHRRCRLRPIRGRHREDVREALPVRRIGAPEARRQARDLVFHVPRRQRVDDRRAVIHRRHAALALDAFVSLNAAVDLVGVLHLDVAHRMAVDTALLVDQLDVVVRAGTQQRADELRRAGAVALPAHDNLIGRQQSPGAEQQRQHTCKTEPFRSKTRLHGSPPLCKQVCPMHNPTLSAPTPQYE